MARFAVGNKVRQNRRLINYLNFIGVPTGIRDYTHHPGQDDRQGGVAQAGLTEMRRAQLAAFTSTPGKDRTLGTKAIELPSDRTTLPGRAGGRGARCHLCREEGLRAQQLLFQHASVKFPRGPL